MAPIDRKYIILLCLIYAVVSGAMLVIALMFGYLVAKGLGIV